MQQMQKLQKVKKIQNLVLVIIIRRARTFQKSKQTETMATKNGLEANLNKIYQSLAPMFELNQTEKCKQIVSSEEE